MFVDVREKITYITLAVLLFIFILDFFINGRILQRPKNLIIEGRLAYQLFLHLSLATMAAITATVGVASFFEKSKYDLYIGAATFAILFSTLCFTVAPITKANDSRKNYTNCGKRFFEAALNLFYLIILKYLFDLLVKHLEETSKECVLHPIEISVQAFIVFVAIIFLFVGIGTFVAGVVKLQKELITHPDLDE